MMRRLTTRDRLLMAGTLQNEHVAGGLYLADKIADARRDRFDLFELHADDDVAS